MWSDKMHSLNPAGAINAVSLSADIVKDFYIATTNPTCFKAILW